MPFQEEKPFSLRNYWASSEDYFAAQQDFRSEPLLRRPKTSYPELVLTYLKKQPPGVILVIANLPNPHRLHVGLADEAVRELPAQTKYLTYLGNPGEGKRFFFGCVVEEEDQICQLRPRRLHKLALRGKFFWTLVNP